MSDESYNYEYEPLIIHKFKGEKYLSCKSYGFPSCGKSNCIIIKEKEGKFFQEEEANDDKILGDNTYFSKIMQLYLGISMKKLLNF